MKYFTLPDLGEGLQEAEIVEWSVAAGDRVALDQLLVTVETAKALVEIPSPQAGTVAHLFGDAGDTIHVGEPLLEFAGEQEDTSTTVVGAITEADGVAAEPEHFSIGVPGGDARRAVAATPAIRALAARLAVDLASVQGSGPGGVITGSDIEHAVALDQRHGAAEPLRGVRLAMARNMAQAHGEVAQATVFDDVDIQGWPAGADITLRVILALARACAVEPGLNAWYDGHSCRQRRHRKVDIGVAVDTEDGLFVPVLRDVGARSPDDVAAGFERLKADARARALPPAELRNPTITLSNFGSVGGRYATPLVMPPTVAIIGVGAVTEAVVPRDAQPVIVPLLPLSLSFDHRCVTGSEATRFLLALKAALGAPT